MFITFEGVEGSSKTTQAELLSKWLDAKEIDHILTKEPGTNRSFECRKIREIILNPQNDIVPKAEFLLYLADRAQHVEQCLRPALKEDKWVISDRYSDSTRVYQGIGRDLGGYIDEMIYWSSGGLEPDLVFVLDVPADVGLKRAIKSNKEFVGGDRIERESIEFHNSLRDGFLKLASTHDRYVVVDATQSIEEMHKEVIEILNSKSW